MPAARAAVGLLDACLTWASDAILLARAAPGRTPTPCEHWRLPDLLSHLDDSLATLDEAVRQGGVSTDGPDDRGGSGRSVAALVDRTVVRALALRQAWDEGASSTAPPVAVGDLALPRPTVALVLALEVAVHGWDVARSVTDAELPADLAVRLLPVATAVVAPGERGDRFAEPLPARPDPAGRLLAHLGRDPGWTPCSGATGEAGGGGAGPHPAPW